MAVEGNDYNEFGLHSLHEPGDSPLTKDKYSSIESEEEMEQLFNAGVNNGLDKEGKEETIQQDRKDEDRTNDTSEETVEKKDKTKITV